MICIGENSQIFGLDSQDGGQMNVESRSSNITWWRPLLSSLNSTLSLTGCAIVSTFFLAEGANANNCSTIWQKYVSAVEDMTRGHGGAERVFLSSPDGEVFNCLGYEIDRLEEKAISSFLKITAPDLARRLLNVDLRDMCAVLRGRTEDGYVLVVVLSERLEILNGAKCKATIEQSLNYELSSGN